MSHGFPSSGFGHGVSDGQTSSTVRDTNRASTDHAFSSGNSISSYDGSMLNADIMSRSVSNDGTLESWQWVNDSPSPRVDSSPELARSTPYSPLHGNMDGFPDRGLADHDFSLLSQHSSQEPDTSCAISRTTLDLSSNNLDQRQHIWNEQPAEETGTFPLNYTFSAPAPTYSTAYDTASHLTSAMREDITDEAPWSHYPHSRMVPRAGHELGPTTTGFVPFTYDQMIIPQLRSSPQFHQSMNFDLPVFDDSQPQFSGYLRPHHRSRSSSSSQVAKLTPSPTAMNISISNPQVPRQLSHLSLEPPALSHSLIAHAGSEKDITSSPSSTSDFDMVERSNHPEPSSATSRKRPRTASNLNPPNGQGHGKFIKLNFPINQHHATQNVTGVSKKTIGKGRGGRKKGAHLSPEKANDAREMRHVIACWVCALQRDHCTPDSICTRCVKRQERGVIEANHSIGCIREKLYDYMNDFIPDHMNNLYGANGLKAFADAQIGKFLHTLIRIEVQPIHGFPLITCDLYEYEPTDRNLLIQHQYWQNGHTRQYHSFESTSAPITFKDVRPNANDQTVYEKYVSALADSPEQMRYFARKIYFAGEEDPFLANLFTTLVDFRPQGKPKLGIVGSVNKLLLTGFVFARGCLIPQQEQHKFRSLRFFQENERFSFWTLPRMASRQFKHVFLQILTKTLECVLRRLDRVFRSSQGCKEWTTALYGVLGLAMAFEYIQASVCANLHADFKRNTISYHEAEAKLNFFVRKIDEKFFFMSKLFRLKYKTFNPISNEECRDRLDIEGSQLVTRVAELLSDNWDFVCERQRIQPTLDRPNTFCGRLVSQFLCSVSPP